MGFAQQQHAQAALANAAAHRQGQLAFQQHFVERQFRTLRAACGFQLAGHGGRVHTDAHAGKLQCTAQRFVPEQNIAVQRPVIIVRGTAIVADAAFQLAADLHDADGAMGAGKGVFALFGGQVGVQVFQLLGGDKGRLTGQADGFQLRELPAQLVRSGANGIHNIAHGFLQKGQGAVLRGDDLLPVPLVYINAVQVVKLFVAADGVHVGHKSLAGAEPILSKGIALPFGQAVHNFSALIQAGYIKADGALHAVQIIVQAAAVQNKQRGGNALQVQGGTQLFLKDGFDDADGPLGIVQAQKIMIVFGNGRFGHKYSSFPLYLQGSV